MLNPFQTGETTLFPVALTTRFPWRLPQDARDSATILWNFQAY